MNSEIKDCCKCGTATAYAVAIVGAFLIVAALVWAMRQYIPVQPLNAARALERAKALAEIRATETEALNNVGWIDQTKGQVRLPVAEAMKLMEREWGNNAAEGREKLIARVEKANPPPPAPKPAAPSQFE